MTINRPVRGQHPRKKDGPNINHEIEARTVRLVDENGEMCGVVSTRDAIEQAERAGLDLVEVSPNAEPPVCKILDYGKYKYELQKKASEAKKKQKIVELKEVKIRPTTEEHDQSRLLGLALKDKAPWKGILAVTRGGMIPACLVAQEIGVKHIETISIESYSHQDQASDPIIHYKPDLDNGGQDWLIIDDLSDTGNTFKLIKDMFPKAHRACVYVKPNGADQADTFMQEITQETWIYFPWELEAQKFADYL